MLRDLVQCESWLRAHRLALGALNILQADGRDPAPVRSYVENEILNLSPEQFNGLPLLTLGLLDRLHTGHLEALSGESEYARLKQRIAEARIAQTKDHPGTVRPPVARGAQLVAQMLLQTTTSARALAGVGRESIDATWQACVLDRDLRDAVEAVSASQVVEQSTADRVKAIGQLASIVKSKTGPFRLSWWPQVEYHLVNRLFAWPLCALREGTTHTTGLSYPLSIDVRPGTPGMVRLIKGDGVTAGDKRDNSDFVASMQTAFGAGLDLWHSQNGSAPEALKKHVARAELIVDCTPTSAIVSAFGPHFGAHIVGRSLEAYVATLVLGRLSGVDLIPPIAISATIGTSVDIHSAEDLPKDRSTIDAVDDTLPAAAKKTFGFWPNTSRRKALEADFYGRTLDRVGNGRWYCA
jgi:hypothetical protein